MKSQLTHILVVSLFLVFVLSASIHSQPSYLKRNVSRFEPEIAQQFSETRFLFEELLPCGMWHFL